MNILINCTGLKKGGGIQVADSICCSLEQFPEHKFVVVLPASCMHETYNRIKYNKSLKIIRYDLPIKIMTVLTGREFFLDKILNENKIDGVLTIFGPSMWSPRCSHLSGFARSQLILTDSPYFTRMSKVDIVKNKIVNLILKFSFNKSSKVYYTENPYITEKLKKLFPKKRIYTVTNYYNQIFDNPNKWTQHSLTTFKGTTLLSINAPYSHKNMGITVDIAKILKEQHPDFNFRFVMTVNEKDIPQIPDDLKKHFELIGNIEISECPSLYQQADICFQPTLLECFTATYAEAMRMKVPIITTNIEFAKGLCADAAEYYSALSAQSAADVINNVATDELLQKKMIENGNIRLKQYDSYQDRITKLLKILEMEIKENNYAN